VKPLHRTAIPHRSRRRRRLLCALLTISSLAGCGSAAATHGASSAAATPTSCATAVASTLGQVAARVYHVAATGGDVAEAVHRVQSSTALASTIDSANAAGARAALGALLLNQIVRVEVLRGGHIFAQAGSGPAIAPVHGQIPGTSATFVLSVQSDHTYVQVVHQVTGAQILLTTGSAGGAPHTRRLAGTIGGPPPASVPTEGPLSYAGQDFQAFTLAGAVYPSGSLHIVLLVPTSEISCPGSSAQAHVETLGHAGERIYQEELHSPVTSATLRYLESSAAFQRAVAAQDAAATHAAIEGFFKAHIHVVRVRVTIGSRLLIDVGGPYALAPVHGTLRSGGRVVGHFEMAIQDDAGYLKLAHLFTGAEVLMRIGSSQVMGTLSPGPATVPDRGTVSYRGRSYGAYSFTGVAFPSGPLRISLMFPTG
jgi:hypothetical protein